MKMKDKSARKLYVISFLVALLPRLIFLKWTYPVNIPIDEMSMFLPIAEILDWDWSGMIRRPLYYGYGFISFLIPLFAIIDDGVLLYRIIVLFMILAQALIAPCACYIVRRFFKIQDNRIVCLMAAACSYMVTQRAVYVYNEFIYVLGVWIIAVILLLIQQNQNDIKKKRILSAVLALAMTYELTLHARALTFFIAAAVLCGLYYWLYRKHFLSYISFGCVGIIGYFADYYIKNRITGAIFTENIGEVANGTVGFSAEALFSSPKALTGWMDITLGQINSMLIVTAGIAIFFAAVGCIFIWKTVIRDKVLLQEKEEHVNYVVVFGFFMAAMAMTIIALSFSWLGGVIPVIESGGHADALRSITYLRYYGAYFGPVVLAGMVYLYSHKKAIGKLILPCMIIVGILQFVWTVYIVPYLVGFGETSFDSYAYAWMQSWKDDITFYSYIPAVFAVLIGSALFAWLCWKRKYEAAFGLFAVVLIYGYSYQAINYEGYRGVENYKSVDSSYELLKKLDKAEILPETIYVEDSGAKTLSYSTGSMLQFLMKDRKVTFKKPDITQEICVFLTGDIYDYPDLLQSGFLCAQLDEEEFIYVKGKELQDFLENEGVNLEEYLKFDTSMQLYRFETEFTEHRSRTQICSDGNVGYLFYGYRFRYGGGALTTTISLELQDNIEDKVGTFEFVRSNGRDIYFWYDVYAGDFDEEGKLQLEIPTLHLRDDEAVELRFEVTEGSRVTVNNIRVSNDPRYQVGVNNVDEIETLGEVVGQFENTEKVYFVNYSGTYEADTSYLEKKWEKEVEVIGWDTLIKKDITKKDAIFVIEGQEGIFEMAEHCPIISVTKNFTLFASEEQRTKNQLMMEELSDEMGIPLSYFQRDENGYYDSGKPFFLEDGIYKIIVTSEDSYLEDCMVQVMEYGKMIGEGSFIQGKSGEYNAEIQIRNDEGFGELEVDIRYPLGYEPEKQPMIHIQKIKENI